MTIGSTKLLKSISQKLQVGETLTASDEAHMIAGLTGGLIRKFYVCTGDGGTDELAVVFSDGREFHYDPWPSKNAQAAYDFALRTFPNRQIAVIGPLRDVGKRFEAKVALYRDQHDYVCAPNPSTAIMAACIEAFLAAKGGEG